MGILSCSEKHLIKHLPEISLEADNVLNELVTLKEDIEQTEQTRCELITISCNWREAIRNELRGEMASL